MTPEQKDRLEELQLKAELKKNIIAQAQVYYGPKYPVGSWFSVVSEWQHHEGEGVATAWLIVYLAPKDLTRWKCIKTNGGVCSSILDALEYLLDELQNGFYQDECTLHVGMESTDLDAESD